MGSPPRGGSWNGFAPTWGFVEWVRPHVGVRGMGSPPRGGSWNGFAPRGGSWNGFAPTRGTTSGGGHSLRWRGEDHLTACDLRCGWSICCGTQLTALMSAWSFLDYFNIFEDPCLLSSELAVVMALPHRCRHK